MRGVKGDLLGTRGGHWRYVWDMWGHAGDMGVCWGHGDTEGDMSRPCWGCAEDTGMDWRWCGDSLETSQRVTWGGVGDMLVTSVTTEQCPSI